MTVVPVGDLPRTLRAVIASFTTDSFDPAVPHEMAMAHEVDCLSCVTIHLMKRARISRGGQVSIPADIRHRWKAEEVLVEDQGDALVLRPLPVDPIAAAMGSLRGGRMTSDEARARLRDEDAEIEDRRARR